MRVWRISNHARLDGAGGLRASGRWHSRGRRIVYCAESPAAALLEILVHLELAPDDLPLRYRLLAIELPDDLPGGRIEPATLPPGWTEDVASTRARGDAWLAAGRTARLDVPSALVPETWNILLNPAHPDAARARIVTIGEHPLDARLRTRLSAR